ncbi:aminodeoxychorismate synthase, component I [Sphingomonas metalli]|uniref:Probable branched-chain-amino-acid aminotransferase n=1 Tax=Sphingomonas metalli TaxID=1779358 RepID=A0A916T0T3_9SPHN|nr:aminodeoxychorismate synthase component I [Sphingomonas metalli]GGB25929.1 aminodeoxychorismate synthase, component I [Sphingomonas metalli]
MRTTDRVIPTGAGAADGFGRWRAPFVLLDDARPGGTARLYRDPVEILVARTPSEVRALLDRLRTARGLHAAGFLSYEAAPAFDPAMQVVAGSAMPLAWFGLFEKWDAIDPAASLPDPAGAHAGAPVPRIAPAAYRATVEALLAKIGAGDLYQANLTFPTDVAMAGDPLSLYAGLRARAAAGYGAVVATGAETLLSLSPELFFTLMGDRLTCRPMKGTARRGATRAADDALAASLAADPKQRAENLMIVDLMRNDLSRVAESGSVAVPELFAVERYPTVQQMTSTVTATLADGRSAVDVLAATFPCGSITGAPKLAAMAAIATLEESPRGAYTGSIGRIDANGDAAFNVAIRTLAIPAGATQATLSLGSGIVADSDPAAEWEECLTKGAFISGGTPTPDLIETMAFDPEEGLLRLDLHLARMKASAAALGFAFDRHAARNELQAATFRLRGPRRIRLVLAPSGAVAIESGPLPAVPDRPMTVAIRPLPVPPGDLRLRHKTADRGFYDAARRAAGTEEVVFEHDGRLTEGSFTSIFVPRGALLVTPAADADTPMLPGVLRAALLAEGRAVEGVVTRADLAHGFFLGNALRGLIPALVAPDI